MSLHPFLSWSVFHLSGAPVTPQTAFRAALLVESPCVPLFKNAKN